MTDPLDATTFTLIVEDLGFPGVRLGDFVIAGERSAWESAYPSLWPEDRQLLLPLLHDSLLRALPNGRARWERAQTAVPLMPSMTKRQHRDSIRDRMVDPGDESIGSEVVEALASCPEMVQDAALSITAWLCVGGRESLAWTSSAVFMNSQGDLMTRVVVIGPTADAHAIRHEIAHVWFSSIVAKGETPQPALTNQGEQQARAVFEPSVIAAVDDGYWREERFADALAYIWGIGV